MDETQAAELWIRLTSLLERSGYGWLIDRIYEEYEPQDALALTHIDKIGLLIAQLHAVFVERYSLELELLNGLSAKTIVFTKDAEAEDDGAHDGAPARSPAARDIKIAVRQLEERGQLAARFEEVIKALIEEIPLGRA